MSRTQEKINQPLEVSYAGIDVSKDTLDLCILPHGLVMRCHNNADGIRKLAATCHKHDVALVAVEATGKYHYAAHEIMHKAGLNVAVINPFHARQFAQSMGQIAKTDMLDAHVLANFAQRMKPEARQPAGEQEKNLHELQSARRQVLEEMGDLKRRLKTAHHPLAAKQIRTRLRIAQRHKEALEAEIHSIINNNAHMKHKFEILITIPGIGKTTAAIMLSDLNELGQVNAKQIAALAGVAPMNNDSGTKKGYRTIRGGRRTVRNALYMCAVACIRRSNPLGAFYRKMIARGKNPKIALTAVMRKMVIIANTLIAENRKWENTAPS